MSRNKKGEYIRLRGVRQNNLKGFDLNLMMNRLIVITGPSGSGKSSLAFDTLYAEGQRRYIETFSPYARQFFDRMDKPRVDSIESIPPAIAIEQKNSVRTVRSTVGTMTEICDYLKVVMPVISCLYCKECGQVVKRESPQDIVEVLMERFSSSDVCDLIVAFNLNLSEKLSLNESLNLITKQGYQRILVDGKVVRIDDVKSYFGNKRPAALIIVQDRLRLETQVRSRFIDACEQAYHFGKGNLSIYYKNANNSEDKWQNPPINFSNRLHCARCNIDYEEPSPSLFSYNHPLGACKTCNGFGRIVGIDYNLVIPNPNLSIAEGVIRPWQSGFSQESHNDLIMFCKKRGVPIDIPFDKLPPEQKKWVIEGDKDYGIDENHSWPRLWYGVKGYFDYLESRSYKMHVRVLLSRYRSYNICPDCKGARFQPDSLLYKFEIDAVLAERLKKEGKCASNLITIAELYLMPINDALEVVKSIRCKIKIIGKNPAVLALDEVISRLEYLAKIGLGYLTLNRPSRTLSGGETERVNLTACLGSRLVNTLYILDEPSVGLHPRDTDRLISILKNLRDIGNTVVVVEHEPSVIIAADQIVDLGPCSGESGGNLVFQGEFKQLLTHPSSLTGLYISGRKQIQIPPRRAIKAIDKWASPFLTLSNASRHNLKNITVDIPLKRLVCVTGVSGSGKSTLIRECLLPILQRRLLNKKSNGNSLLVNEDKDDSEDGSQYSNMMDVFNWELIDDVMLVDQSPPGKTPRSNPALYIGAFDYIRELFANSPPAITHNLTKSSFSFNSSEGKCPKCEGAGYEKIEMQFLSDIFIKCPECNGTRYKKEILEIKISPNGNSTNGLDNKERNIAEVLDSTVDEMIDWLKLFTDSKPAEKALKMLGILKKVGLSYIRLGQPITTLSGGECQRLKLARCLAEVVEKQAKNQGDVTADIGYNPPYSILFLFDEPTTGLHFDDVGVLLNAFNELVNQGHSVVVIEHNLEVIKCADWIIDLGPEAGDNGGKIVICGTPEVIANCPLSYTGKALKNILLINRNNV